MASATKTGILLTAGLLITAAPGAAQRPPATGPTNLAPGTLAMGCAPALAFAPPPMPLRITGGQDGFKKLAYSTAELVTINAGSKNGIEVGQEYFVRRALPQRGGSITPENPASIKTAAWIKVYAVDDEMSLATVTHACDTIQVDDYLEKLEHRDLPTPSGDRGKPKRGDYGRVMLGEDRRTSFAKGDFFILDRGADFNIVPGAEFIVYRDKKQSQNFLYEIGEAVAVSVNSNWSTLRLTMSRDAIQEGDYVGMRLKE
jgi:hypothetical protein